MIKYLPGYVFLRTLAAFFIGPGFSEEQFQLIVLSALAIHQEMTNQELIAEVEERTGVASQIFNADYYTWRHTMESDGYIKYTRKEANKPEDVAPTSTDGLAGYYSLNEDGVQRRLLLVENVTKAAAGRKGGVKGARPARG